MENIIPTKPQKMFKVIGFGIAMWKRSLIKTIPFSIVFILVRSLMLVILNSKDQIISKDLFVLNRVVEYLVYASYVIIFVINNVSITYIINSVANNKDSICFKPVMWISFKKIFSQISIILLIGIIIGIGFILLIIPGIMATIFFMFAATINIIDNYGIIDSLKNSYKLVSKNWWNTFITLTAVLLLIFSISFIFHIISIYFKVILTYILNLFNNITNYKDLLIKLLNIHTVLTTLLLTPLHASFLLAMLYNLKAKNS